MSLVGCVENARGLPVRVSRSAKAPTADQVAALDANAGNISVKADEFCWLFASDRNCRFSGMKAYQKAFGCSEISARDVASRLLNKPEILARIQQYLKLTGFTVESAQAAHADILRNSEDEKTRLAAVKLLYEFEGRMVARTESTHLHLNLASLLKQAKESKTESGAVIDAEIEIEGEEST